MAGKIILSRMVFFANKVTKDSVKLTDNYYAFLEQYNMNDSITISSNHVNLLYSFFNYVNQNQKDSISNAHNYFNKGDFILDGKILKNMILSETTGFTRNLFLSRFYLDALNGKQLKVFEAVFDPNDISNKYFTKIVDEDY